MAGRSYRVGEVLGAGGFGTVYRAELLGDAGFRKPVALKVLHPGRGSADRVARLRDEARILGRLRHRALVGVDALVRLDGQQAVVMELVPGRSLDAVLREVGPLPPTVALELAAEVAAGLEAAHAATEDGRALHLVHRDVKPANVHLTPQGEVKLLDFGIARADLAAREAETRDGVYGSPPYLAPERLEGEDTPAGDVFALGVTLAELLTGERPEGPLARPEPHAARLAALRERLGALGVGPELPALVAAMLAYDPADRPTAAAAGAGARALRDRLDGPSAAGWAAERAWPAAAGVAGPLTGRVLAEAGGSLETTDLSTLAEDPAATATVDPAPDALPATPRPALRPAPRGWLLPVGVGLGALGGFGIAGVVAAGVVAAGALGAAGVWRAGVGRAACASTADEMRTLLRGVSGDTRSALAIAERVDRQCARGEIGLLTATLVLTELQRTTGDGVFAPADAEDLEVVAAQFLAP